MYLYNTICGTFHALLLIIAHLLQSLPELVMKPFLHVHRIKNAIHEIHLDIR